MADTSPVSTDLKSHEKGYSKFITVFRMGSIIAFVIAVVVVYLIAN